MSPYVCLRLHETNWLLLGNCHRVSPCVRLHVRPCVREIESLHAAIWCIKSDLTHTYKAYIPGNSHVYMHPSQQFHAVMATHRMKVSDSALETCIWLVQEHQCVYDPGLCIPIYSHIYIPCIPADAILVIQNTGGNHATKPQRCTLCLQPHKQYTYHNAWLYKHMETGFTHAQMQTDTWRHSFKLCCGVASLDKTLYWLVYSLHPGENELPVSDRDGWCEQLSQCHNRQ